jgi:hypothetical protein
MSAVGWVFLALPPSCPDRIRQQRGWTKPLDTSSLGYSQLPVYPLLRWFFSAAPKAALILALAFPAGFVALFVAAIAAFV